MRFRRTRLAIERACAIQTHKPGSSARHTRLALERREERGERACALQAHTPGYREGMRDTDAHACPDCQTHTPGSRKERGERRASVRAPGTHAWL